MRTARIMQRPSSSRAIGLKSKRNFFGGKEIAIERNGLQQTATVRSTNSAEIETNCVRNCNLVIFCLIGSVSFLKDAIELPHRRSAKAVERVLGCHKILA